MKSLYPSYYYPVPEQKLSPDPTESKDTSLYHIDHYSESEPHQTYTSDDHEDTVAPPGTALYHLYHHPDTDLETTSDAIETDGDGYLILEGREGGAIASEWIVEYQSYH